MDTPKVVMALAPTAKHGHRTNLRRLESATTESAGGAEFSEFQFLRLYRESSGMAEAVYVVSFADGTMEGGKLAIPGRQVNAYIAGVQEGMRVARVLDGTWEPTEVIVPVHPFPTPEEAHAA